MKKVFLIPALMFSSIVAQDLNFVNEKIEVGLRPFHLINAMKDSPLKDELKVCLSKKEFKKSDFSIGHRGAALAFPEHTKEGYLAAAKMGAGIIECDVAFTKDKELVCRHSQCDLHTTTNILKTDLADKCTQNFIPAKFDENGTLLEEASAKCCTSDITLAEFKTLKGKMDSANKNAKNLDEYMNSTPSWRTDLFTEGGTLLSHKESIELFKVLGVKMTPELKTPEVKMPFDGNYTQEMYAKQLLNEYEEAGVDPKHLYPQSFNLSDVKFWVKEGGEYGKQGVYLTELNEPDTMEKFEKEIPDIKESGIKYVAPALFMLANLDENKKLIPSKYATMLKEADLNIISWTLERSGLLRNGGGWYYTGLDEWVYGDGNSYELLDFLAQDVGIIGLFSDWPATVTFYANCKNVKNDK